MNKKSKPYPTADELNGRYVVKDPPTDYDRSNPVRYTYADYLSWADESRRELIDGVAYLFSAPSRWHALLSTELASIFHQSIRRRKKKCEVYHAPFDVRLPRNGETANERIDTVVQPDICVVCDPDKLDNAGCIGAPDLIVEVQSPSTARRDLREKFDLYERSGVREYWVVFPRDKGITVFTLQENGKYNKGKAYEFTGKVPVGIFEGLEIDLKELFEN
ncbi:MAG: Uma2 family endonuclease [Dysgonamonadaceae bacterium]|jgi:Uma2 family endonuclease|nr:Uma2 family endonuclease [Dysgonamonadaceae bacterium]